MADYENVIVVDFDNTICPFSEDFTCTGLVPGAAEGLARLKKAGYFVTISSARNNVWYGGAAGEAYGLMVQFLEGQSLLYDRLDTGCNGKPVGYAHIDDKGVGCPLTPEGWVDWYKVCDLLGV